MVDQTPSRTVIASDGIRLSVRESGPIAAPVLVAIHGYPDDSSLWDGVASELSDRYRMIVYDVRGAGATDRPRHWSAYRLDQLADDLATVITQASPNKRVHLLAHDWGSIQAWHALTQNRLADRIASYTSISGPTPAQARRWFRRQLRPGASMWWPAVRQLARLSYVPFFRLPVLPDLAWRCGLVPWLIRRMDPAIGAISLHNGLSGLNLYRANMFRRGQSRGVAPVTVPLQVIVPSRDRFIAAGLQADLDGWATRFRVRTIAGTHWVVRARPAAVARITAELVEDVETGLA